MPRLYVAKYLSDYIICVRFSHAQGLSSAPTMEEEFKEAVLDTEFEEIAPSGADSRGATATAA